MSTIDDPATTAAPPRAAPRKRDGRVLRITGWTLIVLGAYVLEFALYELVGTSLVTKGHQNELRKEFAQLVEDPVVAPTPGPAATVSPPPRAISSKAIALLKIPSIGVDVIVVEGARLSDLSYGPGRYPSTAKLGEEGSTALAGHRTGWGSPFLNLDKLNPGDVISVESIDGTIYTYRVTRRTIVGASATWVLRGNPESKATTQLTLTTCDPKFTSRNRLIVWADLVSAERPA